MNTHVLRQFTILAVLLLLSACAQPAIPYDRGAAPPVQTVGVLTPAWPDAPVVVLASTVGQSFGLIGLMVDAGMARARQEKFEDLLKARGYVARDHFQSYLQAALADDGYTVVPIPVTRSPGSFIDHPVAAPAVDALLDCIVGGWGYMAAGIGDSTPYRPAVALKCRLMRTSNRQILMQDSIIYNVLGPARRAVTIAPDPNYAFADFDALTSKPEQTVGGLDVALHESTRALGTLLK